MKRIAVGLALATAFVAATPARADDEVTFAQPAITFAFSPIYIAEEMGFWTKSGLKVKTPVIVGIGAMNAVLSKSVVRFRLPWQWNGSNALLQSRATDEKGNVQPTRKAYKEAMAVDSRFHNNTIVTWSVDADGSIKNVFA